MEEGGELDKEAVASILDGLGLSLGEMKKSDKSAL